MKKMFATPGKTKQKRETRRKRGWSFDCKKRHVSDKGKKIDNAAVEEERFQQERKYQNTNKGDVHSDPSWKSFDLKKKKLDGGVEEKVATKDKKGKERQEEKEDKVLVGGDDVDIGLISNIDNIYSCDYDERLFK